MNSGRNALYIEKIVWFAMNSPEIIMGTIPEWQAVKKIMIILICKYYLKNTNIYIKHVYTGLHEQHCSWKFLAFFFQLTKEK